MSKAEGKKIAVKFTLPLLGDVSGNQGAFTVTGQEYQWTDGPNHNGPLVNKTYVVESVDRYALPRIWETNNPVQLPTSETPAGYSNDLTGLGVQVAYNFLNTGYEISKAFDKNASTLWYASGTVGRWIGVDFGQDSKIITKFTVVINPSRFKGYVFEASNDNSNWTPLKSGYFSNITSLQSITFSNINSYRYYRLRCTSVYTGSNVAVNELEMFSSLYSYETEYVENYSAIQHTGEIRLNWIETKPDNTSIIVEYSTGVTQGDWVQADNGEIIDAIDNLWIRATLHTTDSSVTPTLNSVWIEESSLPMDQIMITMVNGFRNSKGTININYNQALGNLAGAGGAVASFNKTFMPTELTEGVASPSAAVGVHDFIEASVSGNMNFIYITKLQTYNSEFIDASISGTIQLIHIDDINP